MNLILVSGGLASGLLLAEAALEPAPCTAVHIGPESMASVAARKLAAHTHQPFVQLPYPKLKGVPTTSFRIGLLLALAAAYGDTVGAREIRLGALAPQGQPARPDLRPEVWDGMGYPIAIGTEASIKVVAPYGEKTVAQLIALGKKTQFPFQLTWSCTGQAETACGVCHPCAGRRQAFGVAKVPDPTRYQVNP